MGVEGNILTDYIFMFEGKALPLPMFGTTVLNYRFANGLEFSCSGGLQTHFYHTNKYHWISKMLEQCWNKMLKWKNWTAPQVSVEPFSGDSAGIQTRNLLIRSQMLYSVKLRNRTLSQTNKEKLRFSLILLNWRQKGTCSFLTLIQKNQVSASLLCRGVVRKTKSTFP